MTIDRDSEYLHRARRLHSRAILIDTHCDTPQRLADDEWEIARRHEHGHVDIPRMREGVVGAIFLAAFARDTGKPGEGARAVRTQIRRIKHVVDSNARDLALARDAQGIRQAHREGRIAILIAVEGGHLIEDSLELLRKYHEEGAIYLTLTHSTHTSWADSSGVDEDLAPRCDGLTSFGREVVAEMNRLGMMVDVSHVSDKTFWDVVEVSRAPIVATHSSCRSVSPHRRNLTDEMMRAIAKSGGVVQINFSPKFINPAFPPVERAAIEQYFKTGRMPEGAMPDCVTPLEILVDHFDHALQVTGPEHVGIGTDFDGIFAVPAGMEDCSKLPYLTAALLRRGHPEADLENVLGENVLRVMDACKRVADDLQGITPTG
ncbi:MAG: dipeptidase [Phycisphaerales bacterium]|nr:MAG: dipeptidase [Phycisphaerales bacterium]